MIDNSVTFFPVGNGDTSLIRLSDGATILLDCNVRAVEPGVYDVHTYLVGALEQDSRGVPHLSAFVLTHPDQDHCRGFDKIFYHGNPDGYGEDEKKKGRIIIDELWFSPRVFNEYTKDLCDDAKVFRREAQRRMDLYRDGTEQRNKPGNRLRVIGYSDNEELEGLEDILIIPGETLNLVNGEIYEWFRFFVYAPIKRDTDSDDTERNDTSIVLQARFDVAGEGDAARVFFGGDTGCEGWERIVDVNDDENLQWDLFLAPHHCSWGFFSTEEYDESNPNPSAKVMSLLQLKRGRAYVVVSSKPIKDDGSTPPPHCGAAKIYKEVVGDDRFLCAGEHPDEKDPEPIYFTMTSNGPVKDDLPGDGKASSSAAVTRALATPRTYG